MGASVMRAATLVLAFVKALVTAEGMWAAKKPAAYEFTIQVSCFCPLPKPPPTYRVRIGVATLLTMPDDPRLSSSSYSFYARFNTIEKLFTT